MTKIPFQKRQEKLLSIQKVITDNKNIWTRRVTTLIFLTILSAIIIHITPSIENTYIWLALIVIPLICWREYIWKIYIRNMTRTYNAQKKLRIPK